MRNCYSLRLALVALMLAACGAATGAQQPLGDGWVRFELAGTGSATLWGASSVLESAQPLSPSRYGPEKALDGNPATAWVEGGAGPGIGESYYLAVTDIPEALEFVNGYAQNPDLFAKNHRVAELRVRAFAAVQISGFATELAEMLDARPISEERSVELADRMERQRVELPFDPARLRRRMKAFRGSPAIRSWDFPQAAEMGLEGDEGLPRSFRYVLRLEIAEVYRGTTWEDTCLAEIRPE